MLRRAGTYLPGLTIVAAIAFASPALAQRGASCHNGMSFPQFLASLEQDAQKAGVSRRAIAYVESAIDGMPELGEAARRIGISPTRLTHVFSREVGIPFRRFVLWSRIKRVAEATQAGKDLTQAAVAAGFSDSAHMSRTFRGMFGLSPSLLLPLMELIGSPVSAE